MSSLSIRHLPTRITPDPKRVIARLFLPGGDDRVDAIINRILDMPEPEVTVMVESILADYGSRHRDIGDVFARHYRTAADRLDGKADLTLARQQLIGAYFTMEYSLESVAVFNPSMVPHPNQEGLADGETRFVISLRVCGEGHVSSIEFRVGVVDAAGDITLASVPPFAASGLPVEDKRYFKKRFFLKLIEMGAYTLLADRILADLPDAFTFGQLRAAIDACRPKQNVVESYEQLADNMKWLASSNYHLSFPEDSDIAERVIFPVTENESRGIEDARFVRFVQDDGEVVYYATYTAYNGFRILPQFIETTDFVHFKINTLSGKCVQNKGLALFPRKINDEYAMIARLDGENIFLVRSDDLHFWNESQLLHGPTQAWEFVQVGNCGSPIETDRGWLVLTHGVGPMRQYWLGAMLLDLEEPAKVIGRLKEPLLMPSSEQRDGYVPNVVYSCGAMIHNDLLVLPYAASDSFTCIATTNLERLLDKLLD